ncbi:hypothetical protein B0H13DRAFT_1904554 [Mycena leptocephala]|nr:hypothetical protein B0H13DRAFT_1904554 [Mycena leptocephala]
MPYTLDYTAREKNLGPTYSEEGARSKEQGGRARDVTDLDGTELKNELNWGVGRTGEQEQWGPEGKTEEMGRVPRTRRLNAGLASILTAPQSEDNAQDIHTCEVSLEHFRRRVRIQSEDSKNPRWHVSVVLVLSLSLIHVGSGVNGKSAIKNVRSSPPDVSGGLMGMEAKPKDGSNMPLIQTQCNKIFRSTRP